MIGAGAVAIMTNPSMGTNPMSLFGSFTTALDSFEGELNILIAEEGEDEPTDIQLRLVDGIGYVNFEALGVAGLRIGRNMELPEWGGVNLTALFTTLMSDMPDGSIEEMMGGMMGGTGGSPMDELDGEVMSNHIMITRLEDSELNGVAVAVFEVSVDFAGLMSDPAMMEMMQEQMTEDLPEGVSIEDMGAMMSAMYASMSASVRSYIGLDDNYVYGVEVNFAADSSAMMEALPEGVEVASEGGATSLSVGLYLTDHNTEQEFTAPEGAVVAEVEDIAPLFAMLMGGFGGN